MAQRGVSDQDDNPSQPEPSLLPVLYPDSKPNWLGRLRDTVELDDGRRIRLDEDGHIRQVL
jgi:hypothetical protein